MSSQHFKSIRQFEKLHNSYLASPNKKGLMIKKTYQIETYVLFAQGDFIIMATINHNRTNKQIGEICTTLIEDAKIDDESCFILKHY